MDSSSSYHSGRWRLTKGLCFSPHLEHCCDCLENCTCALCSMTLLCRRHITQLFVFVSEECSVELKEPDDLTPSTKYLCISSLRKLFYLSLICLCYASPIIYIYEPHMWFSSIYLKWDSWSAAVSLSGFYFSGNNRLHFKQWHPDSAWQRQY